MTADASTHVVYRWPRARLVAVLGRIVMVLGALWVVATIAVAAWDLSGGWLLALGLVSLGVLAASAVLFARPPAILELTEDGYRVSGVRGGGTTAARWTDVRAVSTGQSVAGPVLVLEGRAAPSVVPLELLGGQAADAEARIHALLDAAHGEVGPDPPTGVGSRLESTERRPVLCGGCRRSSENAPGGVA